AAAGEHDVMAERMIIARVRQRADDCPLVAPGSEARQVLADVHARRSRLNRVELAANFGWSVRFGIEAVVLSEAAGEKDIDDRLAGTRGAPLGHRTQRLHLPERQAHQADGAGLEHVAAVENRVLQW